MARGLVGKDGKIAVGDSENGSASLYSDKHDFDVIEIKPPYTVDKYLNVIQLAVDGGYDVLLLDSISHQWKGEGGILNQKEQIDARGGNSFTNWSKLTPEQERFLSSILHSDIHIISTIRSKQEYIIEQNEKGKQAPRKVGLAPIQRDGMEYEFTTVLDIAMNHEAVASKDRTGLFADKVFTITEKTGQQLIEWLNSGKEFTAEEKDSLKPKTNSLGITGMHMIQNGEHKGKFLKDMGLDVIQLMLDKADKYYRETNSKPAGTTRDDLNAANNYLLEQAN